MLLLQSIFRSTRKEKKKKKIAQKVIELSRYSVCFVPFVRLDMHDIALASEAILLWHYGLGLLHVGNNFVEQFRPFSENYTS